MNEPNEVKEHYGAEPLLACIDEVLRRAGLGDRSLDWADLVPLDQFHVRGLGATRELAELLLIDAGTNVLDVCCGLGGPARFLAATYGCHVTGIDLSQPFAEVSWADKTDAGQAWAAEMQAKREAKPAPLGLHIVLGPQFAEMAANLGRNLLEGRVRLVQAIMARA